MGDLNERQEKFAQAYVLYNNATEAAKAAGYSATSAYNQGSRLANDPKIMDRIEELRKEMETKIDVVSEIETQYTYAKNNNHTQSALKALELLSKINMGREQDAPQTIKELEDDIVKSLEVLGEERATRLLLRCSWFQEEEEQKNGEDAIEDNLPSEVYEGPEDVDPSPSSQDS